MLIRPGGLSVAWSIACARRVEKIGAQSAYPARSAPSPPAARIAVAAMEAPSRPSCWRTPVTITGVPLARSASAPPPRGSPSPRRSRPAARSAQDVVRPWSPPSRCDVVVRCTSVAPWAGAGRALDGAPSSPRSLTSLPARSASHSALASRSSAAQSSPWETAYRDELRLASPPASCPIRSASMSRTTLQWARACRPEASESALASQPAADTHTCASCNPAPGRTPTPTPQARS